MTQGLQTRQTRPAFAPDVRPGIRPDVRLAFILSPEFTLLPFAGFIDAVRHAADERDRSRQVYCHWNCISHDLEPVRSSCGMEVLPWKTFDDPSNYDYVVVVGGLLSSFAKHSPDVFSYLREAAGKGVSLVGLCTGSFVLAEAGQLDGVRCAVHVDHVADFKERYPRTIPLPNAIYTFDQDRVTCPGGTAAIDVAVEILSQRCGASRGTKGLAAMVVDQHRKAHHAGRMSFQELEHCGDWRVEQAVLLMRQTLSEPISIDQIARKLSISRRQLNRVFKAKSGKSPQELWRDMRLEHARWRLVNTSKNITQIAHECGFSDCAHFVRWFKRKHDCGPTSFRQQQQR
ncbi:MAG: GlxA family transcriptional regulator [Pseudomonadota bacterium]